MPAAVRRALRFDRRLTVPRYIQGAPSVSQRVEVAMRRFVALLISLLLTGCGSPTEPTIHWETIHVGGRVTNTDGAPIVGAHVKLYTTECPGCTWTEGRVRDNVYGADRCDPDGHYEIVAEAKCIFDSGPRILASANGFRSQGGISLKCTSRRQVIDFELLPE
jgi:hypothetical protein